MPAEPHPPAQPAWMIPWQGWLGHWGPDTCQGGTGTGSGGGRCSLWGQHEGKWGVSENTKKNNQFNYPISIHYIIMHISIHYYIIYLLSKLLHINSLNHYISIC